MLLNDGRADFATNPFNGPRPTLEQARVLQAQGKYFSSITTSFASPTSQMPYSYQSSIGVQRQLGTVMAFDVDYIYTAARHQTVQQDINLAYSQATGINYPFTDRTRKPYAWYGWDQVSMSLTEGKDNYQTVQMSFTKRMANRWQASATYSISADRLYQREPIAPGCNYVLRSTRPAISSATCRSPFIRHSRRSGTTPACSGTASRSTASGSSPTRSS